MEETGNQDVGQNSKSSEALQLVNSEQLIRTASKSKHGATTNQLKHYTLN